MAADPQPSRRPLWFDLFRSFRIATDPAKIWLGFLAVATVAFVLLLAGSALLQVRRLGGGESSRQALEHFWKGDGVKLINALQEGASDTWTDLCRDLKTVRDALPTSQLVPALRRARTLRRVAPWAVIVLLLAWLPWAYFGGAISRAAAFEYATGERLATPDAREFAARRYSSYMWAPVGIGLFAAVLLLAGVVVGLAAAHLVAAVIAVIGLFAALYALVVVKQRRGSSAGLAAGGACLIATVILVWLTWSVDAGVVGRVALTLAFPFLLLLTVPAVLLLLVLLLGRGMMTTTVSYEGTGTFDAISRSSDYVFRRPWHFAFYSLVSAVYAVPCAAFLLLLALGGFLLAQAAVSLGYGPDAAQVFALDKHSGWLPPVLLRAVFVLLCGLVLGWLLALLQSARVITYALIRRQLDLAEPAEIFLEFDRVPPPPEEAAADAGPAAMTRPVIAIVGRPNVGKSTLFNALARRRISIVEPTSGVTRDRVATTITNDDGAELELVDTGGMGIAGKDRLAEDVEEQIAYAIDAAAALVFVADVTQGVVPQDRDIAARLRTLDKPLVLVANKADSPRACQAAAEFHQLGLGEPLPVSSLHRIGTGELRDQLFTLAQATPAAEPEMKIAIVGQRNVGKSTFINALAREKRVIVSEIPGTTRDAVDVRFECGGKTFVAIDTAGLRRARQFDNAIDFFSQVRAEESVRRADVVLLLFDARNKIARVDKHLARYIFEHCKPCVIVVNKWDLATDLSTETYADYFARELPGLLLAPLCFISALEERRIQTPIDLAGSLWKQANTRVSTGRLNVVVEELKTRPQRTRHGARRPKIYYATQVSTVPPTIVLFVNDTDAFPGPARKFAERFLRDHLPFTEVPIRIKYVKAEGRAEFSA